MKIKIFTLLGLGALLFGSFIVGCGGGSGGSSGSDASDSVINGVATKGIINFGFVQAYAVNIDGTIGVELGSDTTDENGQYNIDIGNYEGPVLVEVTGGSYTDEATGWIVDNEALRAVIPAVGENNNVSVTPLTEMAVQIADGTFTLTNINNANATVSVLMGGADIIETQPPDINEDLSEATKDEKNYTILLAAISQMIEDGSAADVAEAVAMISEDLADDGELTMELGIYSKPRRVLVTYSGEH